MSDAVTSERAYTQRYRISTCHDCPDCWQLGTSTTHGNCHKRGPTVRVRLHDAPPPQCPLPKWTPEAKDDDRG